MFGSGFGGQRPSGTQPAFGFGQAQPQTTQPSLFGQPAAPAAQSGSAFGAPAGTPSGGLFGSQGNPQTPAPFGASSGNNLGLGGAQQPQGTAKAPFVATEMPDPAKGLNKTDRFQTITMMPAYEGTSVQELRWQDYQANRKGPNASGGSVSGFGFGSQPAQPQPAGSLFGQQQTSTSPFGGASTNTPFGGASNTGGGLFGRSNSTSTSGTGLFGSNNTQTGGSAFGGPSNTSGGLFGQNNNTSTPAFGQPAVPSPSTGFGFGATNQGNNSTGTGLFGQSNTSGSSGLFGSSNTGFGFGTQPQASAQTSGAFGSNTSGGGLFGQNNTGNTGTNAFGQSSSSPFGGATNNTSGLFGQSQNQNQSQNQAGSLFGNSNTSTGNTGFGFGTQANNNSGGGLFGSSSNSASQNGGSLFGQNNSQPSGGMFGNGGNTLGQQPSSGFGFGSNQNKPATGFGSTNNAFGSQPSTTSAFGSNQGTSSGGLFGQNNNAQQAGNSTGFGFGQNNNTTSNTTAGTGLFGQQQQPKTGFGFGQQSVNTGTAGGTTGGLFGSSANKPASGGLFGGGASSATGTGGGIFGSNGGSVSSGTGSGLFGNNAATTGNNNAATNFGAANNSAAGSNTGGGLFGNSNSNTGGGLFGSKPATGGGLFGNNTTSNNAPKPTFGSTGTSGGTSLFGGSGGLGTNQSQPNQTNGGGLFGSTANNKPQGSLFGGSSTSNNNGAALSFGSSSTVPAPAFGNQNTGGSLFAQQQSSGPVASIGSNAYGSNELFTNVQQPAASSPQNEQPQAVPKKDDATFRPPTGVLLAHIMQPHQLLVKRQKWGHGRNHKDGEELKTLDEYSKVPPWPSSTGNTTESSPQDSKARENSGVATGLASVRFRNVLFSNNTDDIILNSEAFDMTRHRLLPSSRNVIEVDEAPRAISVSTPTKVGAEENNDDSSINAGGEALSGSSPINSEHRVTQDTNDDPDFSLVDGEDKNDSVNGSFDQHATDTPDNEIVNEEGYWISPAQHSLTRMTLREIRNIKDFRVGQRTHGFVEFLEAVDLSSYSNVQAQVCGRIVVISDRSFCLYPVESERPPVGKGFNVKHRVTLYNVFARTRDTQEPIKDPDHPVCKKFAKRLRSKGTFVSWSVQTGTWTFEVDPAMDNHN